MSSVQAIGERLREARMRRKIDIAEVEATTKIRAKYLRALEHEDFDLLPGPTFVKTFLRTYAEYLGLDAQLLIEEYRAQYEPREADAQPLIPASRQRQANHRRRPRAPSGPPGPGTAVIVAVVVVLLIFVILGVTGGSGGGGGSTQPAKTTPKVVTRPKPRPRPTPAVPTTVALRVVPNGPTYVCVDHGRGTSPVVDSNISQPMTFYGKHLRINAGKPDVTLIVNGKRVQIPATANPVGYDFRPTSTTPIPPGPLRPCLG
jgi:cytoskeleton protein RodZ